MTPAVIRLIVTTWIAMLCIYAAFNLAAATIHYTLEAIK